MSNPNKLYILIGILLLAIFIFLFFCSKNISKSYYTDTEVTLDLQVITGNCLKNKECSLLISNKYHLLLSLSNLPKNEKFVLTFNDLNINLRSDMNGNYTFLEPLPIYLLPYDDKRVNFEYLEEIVKASYKILDSPLDIGNSVDIKIKATKFYPKIFKNQLGNTPETGSLGYNEYPNNVIQPYEDVIQHGEISNGSFGFLIENGEIVVGDI